MIQKVNSLEVISSWSRIKGGSCNQVGRENINISKHQQGLGQWGSDNGGVLATAGNLDLVWAQSVVGTG